MKLLYKTLFEVRLMHEYFQTKEDGTNLFNEPDQGNRMNLLQQLDDADYEGMDSDIRFDFPEALKEQYSGYGLHIVPAYSGCTVAVRVNRITLADNSIVYQPLFSIPETLDIFVLFIRKSNRPDAYSNERIGRPAPAAYFFSSENIPGARVFPFLTNPVSSFDAGYNYEHGELAINSSNKLQEYFYDNAGNLQSRSVNAVITAFANENDRMLVPLSFYYSVFHKNPVTTLDISLTDAASTVLKAFSFSQAEPIKKVMLDFSDQSDALQLSAARSLPAGLVTLQANGNNGYADTRKLIFDERLNPRDCWGVAYFKPVVTNPVFNLIKTDGYIIERVNPLGNITEAPVFEIPVRSRFGNFRYANSNGKELKLNAALNNFLYKEDRLLISQLPVSLCQHYFQVTENGGGNTRKFLPNPKTWDIKRDDKQRMYFDVVVPESDLFPVV
jgi:hypothetical protein